MIVVENAFEIGQTVFLITDEDQKPRIVTALLVGKTHVLYFLACGTDETRHYAHEISAERNPVTTLS